MFRERSNKTASVVEQKILKQKFTFTYALSIKIGKLK